MVWKILAALALVCATIAGTWWYAWSVYMPATFYVLRHELWTCQHGVNREEGYEFVMCIPK